MKINKTMKKNEYVSPEMEIVKIETQYLIAASVDEGEIDGTLETGKVVPDDEH